MTVKLPDSHDDNFPANWTDETGCLVEVVPLPKDEDPEDHYVTVEWVGRVFAFAMTTDTRILAQVGDPEMPAYELWFSFRGEENKQRFLDLVREDGWADPDEEASFDPPPPNAMADLPNLRPIAKVFPEKDVERIMGVAMITMEGMKAREPGTEN